MLQFHTESTKLRNIGCPTSKIIHFSLQCGNTKWDILQMCSWIDVPIGTLLLGKAHLYESSADWVFKNAWILSQFVMWTTLLWFESLLCKDADVQWTVQDAHWLKKCLFTKSNANYSHDLVCPFTEPNIIWKVWL